jgi:long-chain fatty acid transport protein
MSKINYQLISYLKLVIVLSLFTTVVVHAGTPRGGEFDTTTTPTAGGMQGVGGVVRPQDVVTSLFGNPATLTSLEGDTQFTIGAFFTALDVNASTSGPIAGVAGAAFNERSDVKSFAAPQAGAFQRITPNLVAGIGFNVKAALATDFRNPVIAGGGTDVDLRTFAANVGLAYQLTPNLSIGGAMSVGISSLAAGLFQNTTTVNSYGVGGNLGLTYDAGPVVFGAAYVSPLEIEYDDVVQSGATTFQDFTLTEPQQVMLGVSTSDAFLKNTIIGAEWRYKNFGGAEGYEDIWDDQYSISFGVQHTLPNFLVGRNLTLRTGYSYVSDLLKDTSELGTSFGDINTLFVPGTGAVPISAAPAGIMNVFQALGAPPYWRQAVSVGVGIDVIGNLRADSYASFSFDGSESIGSTPINTDGEVFTAGFGLTWKF